MGCMCTVCPPTRSVCDPSPPFPPPSPLSKAANVPEAAVSVGWYLLLVRVLNGIDTLGFVRLDLQYKAENTPKKPENGQLS